MTGTGSSESEQKFVAGGMQNGFDSSQMESLTPRERDLVQRRERLLGPAYKLMYEHPIEFVRGEGVYLYDPEGNAYLDCYNNVVSVGHCNPRVNAAVSQQLTQLNTHTRYLSEPILEYSEELLSTFEEGLENVMYTCTGSEAVDLALRIAKFYTKGTGMIITNYAYHGITAQVAAISSSMGPFVPLDSDVRMVRAPYAYRAGEGVDVGQRLADDIEAAILDMQRHGIKFAGFIADSVFSTDGVLPAPENGKGFLKPALAVVHKYGGLYIADEVQPGFGRLGKTTWGYQQHGIVPDVVVMGKPMGNGMPIAGVVTKRELLAEFGQKARYFNTFGGNPVSIAAARATLREIKAGGAQQSGLVVGEQILAGFRKLMTKFPQIGDARGSGMFFAVEFVKSRTTKEPDSQLAKAVVGRLRDRRVLVSTTGQFSNCLKIRPILTFTVENGHELVKQLEIALTEAVESATSGDADPTNPLGIDVSVDRSQTTRSSLGDASGVVEEKLVRKVLKEHYGFKGELTRLKGERDINYLVRTENGLSDYVLKFLHPSEDMEFSDFQSSLLHYLERMAPQVPIQRVILPISYAERLHALRVDCGPEQRTVRLTTFIHGEVMSTATQSLEQKFNLGRVGGQITAALQSFHHLGQNHTLLWDIQHASDLRPYLAELSVSEKQRHMLNACLEIFEHRVKPKYPHLRRGVVHNDLNQDNVVVSCENPDQIDGVLDFGDAVFTHIVNDVAVGAVYQMGIRGTKLLDGSLAFIRGYHSAFPLTDEESTLLFDLMLTRMFVRSVIHTWRAAKFPGNQEYILRNTATTWAQMEDMLENKEDYRYTLEHFADAE